MNWLPCLAHRCWIVQHTCTSLRSGLFKQAPGQKPYNEYRDLCGDRQQQRSAVESVDIINSKQWSYSEPTVGISTATSAGAVEICSATGRLVSCRLSFMYVIHVFYIFNVLLLISASGYSFYGFANNWITYSVKYDLTFYFERFFCGGFWSICLWQCQFSWLGLWSSSQSGWWGSWFCIYKTAGFRRLYTILLLPQMYE